MPESPERRKALVPAVTGKRIVIVVVILIASAAMQIGAIAITAAVGDPGANTPAIIAVPLYVAFYACLLLLVVMLPIRLVDFIRNASVPVTVRQPRGTALAPGLTASLERLTEMHRDGVLTDEEFASAKARVIGQD